MGKQFKRDDMFKKTLDFVDDLVLIYDKNLSLLWANKAFYAFKKTHNIQNLDDFFQIDKIKHNLENKDNSYDFNYSFDEVDFDVKSSYIDEDKKDEHILVVFSKTVHEKTIYKLTYTDSLTLAGNRELNVKKIYEFYEKRKSNPKLKMLAFGINFRHFEKIDYFYGFDIGDKILRDIAKSLQALSVDDMVFRISGTQLVMMYEYEDDDFDINAYTKKVIDVFKTPICIDETNTIQLFTNIGVVVLPKDGNSKQDVLKNLMLAYEESKKHYEKVSLVFYKDSFSHKAIKDLDIEKKLEEAIHHNHLELFYQPKIHLKSKKIYGFEALIRWRDPIKGLISPADFIPVAEDTGQIVQIGSWVLKQVCLQSNEWQRQGYNFSISLNVSVRQLQDPNFIDIFTNIVNQTGVDTSLIELEITESILSENLEEIVELFTHIKQLGFSISLDDFGTGYSSLSYLRNIPIDILKVDRSFVKNVCNHSQDAAIAKAIVTLANELSLKVIAEGAEDENQVAFLEDIDCHFVQGFYYYKPMDLDNLAKLIEKTSSFSPPEKIIEYLHSRPLGSIYPKN